MGIRARIAADRVVHPSQCGIDNQKRRWSRFRCTRSVARIVTAATFLSAAAHLQAFSATAYVSICCNAPSTAGVFNASTLAQERTIVTGSGGDGLAVSPDGTKMFVTVDQKHELQVIATSTGTILARVPVPLSVSGAPPLELVISPDGSHVYVFTPQDILNSHLLAIDTTTYRVTQTSTVPYSGSLGPLLISPDGSKLYFEVGYANEYLQVIDAITLKPLTKIPVNVIPTDLAVTPSGLILMTDTNDELLVIDPQSSAVVNRFALPNGSLDIPGVLTSSPDSTTAYISYAAKSILALNIATGATVFDAPISYVPTQFAISPDGSSLYSSNLSGAGAWSLAEFQISTQKEVTKRRQLGPISAVALTSDGQSLYVLNADESAIAAVDVASQEVTHVTLGGVGINSLAIPPGGNTVWASQYAFQRGGDILFLNPATEQVTHKVGHAGALAFSPDGTVVYLANPGVVTALDVASLTPIGSAHAGQLTNIGQAISSPDGTRLYISVSFVSGIASDGTVLLAPGEIRVLDTSTFKYIKRIYVPDGIGALALTPDGSTLVYTANRGRVHLLSTATYKITATMHLTPANGLLNGLALSPDGSTAYVADAENNLLLVANTPTQTQLASIPVGVSPSTVVVTPGGSEVWVATLAGLDIVNATTSQLSGSVKLPGTPSAIAFAP
jgi:YVTN family beta-propeller protein